MPDLAVMKLFSRHLVPGSIRLQAFSFQKPCLAIQRPDGVIVLFMAHYGHEAMNVRLNCGGTDYRLEMAPQSMNAFEIK